MTPSAYALLLALAAFPMSYASAQTSVPAVMLFVGYRSAQNAHDREMGIRDALRGSTIKIVGVREDNTAHAHAQQNTKRARNIGTGGASALPSDRRIIIPALAITRSTVSTYVQNQAALLKGTP